MNICIIPREQMTTTPSLLQKLNPPSLRPSRKPHREQMTTTPSLLQKLNQPSLRPPRKPHREQMTTTPSLLQKLNPPSFRPPRKPHPSTAATTRRSSIILIVSSAFLSTQTNFTKPANAFDFKMTVPDQTVEEAESEIQSHAQSLLEVKVFLMAKSWKEAQKLLRKSSALLKQDIYTIIQGKSRDERPRLRKLYSDLFNGVTKLDYAARDKDMIRVWECYQGILLSLNDILSRV